MTEIHLFRHGQTEANLEGRIQGHENAPLTELGVAQAIEAREKIRGVRFDVVVTSPSGRAVHTADLLMNGAEIPVYTDDGLKEIFLGEWEGRVFEEVQAQHPQQFENFWHAPSQFHNPSGESFADVAHRGYEALKRVAEEHKGKTILVVSHAAFIKTLLNKLLGGGPDDIWHEPMADNLAHSVIHVKDGEDFWVSKVCDQLLPTLN